MSDNGDTPKLYSMNPEREREREREIIITDSCTCNLIVAILSKAKTMSK